jgi:uncharacterized repeat protein (TIGR01451 family)
MIAGNHRAGRRRTRATIVGLFLVAGLGVGQAGTLIARADPPVDSPGPPSADGVQPVIRDTQSSNDDCIELGFDHGVPIAGNGQVSSGALTVTVMGYNSPSGFVDWSSNAPIHGVYVKGGPSGGNLFSYPSGDTGDQDLHTPQKSDGGYYEVSHVAFCWNDVTPEPNVVVVKSNDPSGTVVQGDSITYTLTVTNEGDGTATGVQISDPLPAGVTFDEADPGCEFDEGIVTCVLGEIGAGASVGLDITVTVDEETCGSFPNSAVVSATNESSAAQGNNSSNTVTNTVECAEPTPPDLEVTKTSSAVDVLGDGDRFAYTIKITNVGDEAATGVEVHDLLPIGVDVLVAPFPSFQGDPCLVLSSVSPGGVPVTTVECGPASLAGGESASVTVMVLVNGDACGPITNVVDVEGSNEPTVNVGPETHAEASDEIECVPRIRLLKGGPGLAHVGDTITYVFTVRNNGGVDLTAIDLTDPKCDTPPTLVDGADGDATLAVGEVWEFSCDHTVLAGDGNPIHNEATVSGDHEGGTVSDTDDHDVDVIHPGIRIDKTASPTSGPAGTVIVYTYAVTNTGDTTLFDVSVNDDIEGHIGDIATLPVDATVELTHQITLGSSPITNVGSVVGSDVLGGPRGTVSDEDGAGVTVVAAGGEGAGDGGGTGGSAFTGSDAGSLLIPMFLLAATGATLVLAGRRRPEAGR